jgi:hypothetical protein
MEIANFFWHGDLSYMQKKSLQSFVKNDFFVNLWSYSLYTDLPAGVVLKNAEEILDSSWLEKHAFQDSNRSLERNRIALFSDIFRIKVLESIGGWWFDLDCFCLKNASDFKELSLKNPFVIGREDADRAGTATMNFASKKILKKLSKHIFMLVESDQDRRWGFTGPLGVTCFLKNEGLFEITKEKKFFFPIPYEDYEDAYSSDKFLICKEKIKSSYVYHWWNSMSVLDSAPLTIEDGSLMDFLFKKHKE